MKSLLLPIAIFMMFSGGDCFSQSMSCSTVNGKTICDKQSGSGNVAGALSMAGTGSGGSYQETNAMTGNTGSGGYYSSRTAQGNMPNPFFNPSGFGPGFGAGYAPNYGQGYAPNYGQGFAPNNGPPSFGPKGFDPFAFAGLPNPMFGGGGGAFAFAGRR